MKNKLMKNLSLKILSVVAAFLFWLVIINVTDYYCEDFLWNTGSGVK